eukprot:1516834-Rhodomonas_salina.1
MGTTAHGTPRSQPCSHASATCQVPCLVFFLDPRPQILVFFLDARPQINPDAGPGARDSSHGAYAMRSADVVVRRCQALATTARSAAKLARSGASPAGC